MPAAERDADVNPLAALRREGESVIELADRVARGDVPSADELANAALLTPMRGAPHDPVHHAEGDPLVHTHMVVEELVRHRDYADLTESRRLVLALAALLHDVAKPETAQVTDGRVSHPNHAPRGARRARATLYAAGLDASLREGVASLCRRHMQPHHALASRDGDTALLRWMAAASLEVPMRLLLMLAETDARGRRAPKSDDSASLLADFAAEHDLLERPWPFADRQARLDCCRDGSRDPRYASGVPEKGPLVTILSGLPGSGKSTLAHRLAADGAERVSVEDLIRSGVDRGTAVQTAKERLRQALREGRDALWDATMLTRAPRRQIVGLAEGYGARTRIVCIELPATERAARDAEREHGGVPDAAIAAMLRSWELPTHDEALIVDGRPERP